MTSAVDWVVYGGATASVALVLGLLLWTLQVHMSRELHGEAVATYHQARRQSGDRTDADSEPNR
jgi:hypothetical protein